VGLIEPGKEVRWTW